MVAVTVIGQAARSCAAMESVFASFKSKSGGFLTSRSGQALFRNVDVAFSSLSSILAPGKASLTTEITRSATSVASGPNWVAITETKGRESVSVSEFSLPSDVKLVEVGPRDGLQNEPMPVPTGVKVELIHRLAAAGMPSIEMTSFVSPKWVPQMGDNEDVATTVHRLPGISYPVLVPNLQGYQKAKACGVEEIAVFTTASETFSKKNTNCSIETSLKRISEVIELAKKDGIRVRGYVSCIVGCPYEGFVPPEATAKIAKKLFDMGCYEISLGDTIGVGTPGSLIPLVNEVKKLVPVEHLAMHCHDTYGQALANILAVLQTGIRVFDCSVGGLGGCPYAKGASGNVASEDVVYLMAGLGINTGVDLAKLIEAGDFICRFLGKKNGSKVAAATGKCNV